MLLATSMLCLVQAAFSRREQTPFQWEAFPCKTNHSARQNHTGQEIRTHLPNKDSPVPIPVCTVREIAPLGEGPLRQHPTHAAAFEGEG
jgi:hypothetical protein